MRRTRAVRATLACGFGLSMLTAAHAGTASTTFNVTMTVVKECTVTAPSSISFGSIGGANLMSGISAQSQSYTVLCSSGTPYTIQFTSPNDLSAGSATHQMKGATASNTDMIQYKLVDTTSGATNTSALGGTSSVITATGTGATQTKTLQAAVQAPSSAVTPDVYTDTVTMTVTY